MKSAVILIDRPKPLRQGRLAFRKVSRVQEDLDLKLVTVISAILFLALLPVAFLFLSGYGGHDFVLHVPTWIDLSDLWRAGQFSQGWAPGASFRLGEPTFCYYPPISVAIGAGLTMLLPLLLVPSAFVWLTFTLSGISMYFASADFVVPANRWKTVVLYMASPYLITTSLVRFAAAEALTLAWLPLLILFFHRSVTSAKLHDAICLGGFLALTWLTNVPASIVLFYTLGAVAILHAIRGKSLKPALTLFFANAIGAALAAFYLVPTWVEQGWIDKASVLRFDYSLFFLFVSLSEGPFHLFRTSLTEIACIGTGLIALYIWAIWSKKKTKNETADDTLLTWAGITGACLAFQLSWSAPLWKLLPQLLFAGFPYRFLAPIGVVLPLTLLSGAVARKWRIVGYVAAALMVLIPLLEYQPLFNFPVGFERAAHQWRQFGYRSWPEFTPAGAPNLRGPEQLPPASIADPAANPECSVQLISTQPNSTVLQTNAVRPCQIQVATFFYPYWQAIDETGTHLATEKNGDGLLLLTAPAGNHSIRLEFHASSLPRAMSQAISIAALLLTMFLIPGKFSWQKPRQIRLPLSNRADSR